MTVSKELVVFFRVYEVQDGVSNDTKGWREKGDQEKLRNILQRDLQGQTAGRVALGTSNRDESFL